jgi:hypothetical protein
MTRSSHHGETLPLSVDNTGFLLDRLGEDCHPLQFLRELTQNSIEAINRTGKPGEIVWDVDWVALDLDNKKKLCIIDNGDGMTGDEMVKYINKLSSSSSLQAMGANYGVGAKIAAATRNHAGLIYLSWKNGKGAMIHLWRDPETGQYGLRKFSRPDGSYEFVDIEDDVKPELIKDHGTKVVLYGMEDEANTLLPPESAASPSRWIAKFLNARYYKIADHITLRAREGHDLYQLQTDRGQLRTITGQGEFLQKNSVHSGNIKLTNAKAHWWILKDNQHELHSSSGHLEVSGHVAALYQNELYDMAVSRAGVAKLQQFGVILGHKRVIIYIEPSSDITVTPNTARTQLLTNSEGLPWTDWAEEFRDNMPAEITQLMEEVAAGATSIDHTKSIKERLKSILDLYKLSRYKPSPTGQFSIDPDGGEGGKPRITNTKTQSESTSEKKSNEGGSAGGIYSAFQRKNGIPGSEVRADVFPQVKWISLDEGTREKGDLEDRAARYILDQNLLLINADFRAFSDMVKRFVDEYSRFAAVASTVKDVVHSWFEQALTETVIGIQAIRNSKEWDLSHIQAATSEEALTAVVMARYHIFSNVKRELGAKFGKAS